MTTFDADATYGGDLQAALTAAASAGGGTVQGRSSYALTVPLVISSGTTLDLRGATVSQAAQTFRMLRNASAQTPAEYGTASAPGDARDHDIALVGGTWTATGADNESCRILFNRVDGLSVTGLRIAATAGKFAIKLADLTDFTVTDIAFSTKSDGLHIIGPASGGRVSYITGSCSDDFMAMACSDWASQDMSRGDVSDVAFEHIYPHCGAASGNGSGLHFWTIGDASHEPHDMSGITVRDMRGEVRAWGVAVSDSAIGAGTTISDVLIEDVAVTLIQEGYAVVCIAPSSTLVNLAVRHPHLVEGTGTLAAVVRVDGGQPMALLDVDGLSGSSTVRAIGLQLTKAASIGTARVTNSDLALPTSLSSLVDLGGTGTIGTLVTTGTVTRRNRADFPDAWFSADSAAAYVSGSLLTAAGYAYAGMRARNAIRPPTTGLDYA